MKTTNPPTLSSESREFLDCIYRGHKIALTDTCGKINVLRSQIIKDEVFIASSGGVLDDEAELETLEEYVLSMFDMN